MCSYVEVLEDVLTTFVLNRASFDALEVRDEIRRRLPDEDVRFLEVKHEALAAFERGLVPGYVIDTKVVMVDDAPKSVIVFNPRSQYEITRSAEPAQQATNGRGVGSSRPNIFRRLLSLAR